MSQSTGKEVLLAAFSEKEWNRVPSEIAKKLETYIGEKFDELITARALLETKSYNASHSLSELQTKYDTVFKEHEEQARKLEGANKTIEEFEKLLNNSVADVNKFQATCNKLEQEAADLRNSRNLLTDEHDELHRMVERRNAEVERMQADINALTKQLSEAVNAKCEALANTNEIQSMKLSFEYKEKRMEQERVLLNNQIKQLSDDLNSRTEELFSMRRDNTSRCVQLEIKLAEKIQELAAANEMIRTLSETNKELMEKLDEQREKLATEKENCNKTLEAFENEVQAQKKIATLYKSISDEKTKHADELAEAVQDLKEKLDTALEKYGDLETEHKEALLAHEEILAKKTEYAAMLKKELDTANELLNNKPDLQREVEEISPKAAAASRLIKSGMTMTEIYQQYVQVSEKLAHEQVENNRLQSYIQSIIQEIEDKGPLIAKQRDNYERAMDTINEMTKQSENLALENQQLRDANSDLKRAEVAAVRENARYKKEVTDLSRQVCHLLREVEHSRAGSSSTSTDHDMGDSTCSADIISKRLVTFSDISELQSTNQRLLALVRELSSKQEEAELCGPEVLTNLQMKMETMRENQAELLEQQDKQNSMIKMLMEQRDTYKTLYQQFMKGNGESMQLDADKSSPSPKNLDDTDMQASDEKYAELERSLEKAKKELQLSKEEFETYKTEKNLNEKLLVEQMDKTRSELQELMRQNMKLCTKCETNDEMIKTQKNNVKIYKGQIKLLEDRNRIYGETIAKHEAVHNCLNDQILESQSKLSKAEVMLNDLQKENMLLKEAEGRLVRERDALLKEMQSQSVIHSNIELIKASLERNNAESKIRLEESLTEAHRECAAIRRRWQEEQDRFRELGEHLEKKTQQAVNRMEEEKAQADHLRKDLAEAREDLALKAAQVEELSKKLKNSLLSDVEGSVEGKKYRELEQLLNDTQAEVESMRQKLKIAKDAADQYCNVAQAAERQLIDLNEQHIKEKDSLNKKVSELESKLTDLEEKCSDLQGELSLQSDGQVNVTSSLHVKLNKLEIQYKVAASDLTETKQQLEEARAEIISLTTNLEAAESKYSREMTLHSDDLQTLLTIKEELNKLQGEVNGIQQERDSAREALEVSKASWASQEELYKKEKVEFENRVKNLDTQNGLLLDQLQELNTQMAVIHTQISDSSFTHNKSIGDSSFNKSFIEDEVKSSEQLVKIIKYLRQEKDICLSKCDILEAEHERLKAQHDVLQKQLEEAKSAMEAERQQSDISIVTAARHSEVLRQVETLNAITDSNRSLRVERDGLLNELNELKTRTTNLEDTLAPLQEKNKELQKKAEAMHTENITLRGEATRWRQRANMLIEKSNRSNPEDWKKLQSERETLAKQLTIERANTSKLTEEINLVTVEKNKLQEQLNGLKQQHQLQSEEIVRLRDQVSDLQGQIAGLSHDLDQTRTSLIKMTEDSRVLNDNLGAKETIINDIKNNLAQVRKIAKKYKTQAEEQQKELELVKKQMEAMVAENAVSDDKREELIQAGRSQFEERIQNLEQTHNDQLSELSQQVTTTVEENEKNKREIETLKENLKSSLEKEERFKILFKNAKDRIVLLTDQNNTLKAQIVKDESAKSSTSDAAQQSNNGAEMERLQKEKEDILAEKQQEKERYLQEIEALNQRVNQLQRQLGLQQGSKPSTSSEKEKSTTEPPTANIKPMAGHSTNTQTQSVPIQPWRSGGEPPLASIRPMSMQLRTVAVLPTSQSPSTVMVPPQQQVHTTGSSSIEAMSSSPTSSHTDYVPATSSASSAMLGPRQLAVPPTQSNQDTEDEDNSMQVQQAPQAQVVALILPRVEPPSPAQEQGTSSSSSNTVTTTQAGHKRPREADTESQHDDQTKTQQAQKRTRILQGTSSGAEGSVSESGLEVEYQVPTSSQRDHEEDAVIVVESDEEGPDEGEGEDYNMPYEDPDTQDPDQDDEGGNEVEVIEDSSEVPNQSERGAESDMMPVDGEEEECEATEEGEEEEETMQPEATSSGTNVSTSVAVTLPSFSRTRQVPPLSRPQQSHLLLPHGIEESGDDGIVPSTPTLFVARRCDGFGEAVSSPHVPTSAGRFTFGESSAPCNLASNDVLPEQTLEMTNDDSTGRSVPSTPLQTSPHESGPSSEEQPVHQGEGEIPSITVSGAEDEAEVAEAGESMGPPTVAGTSTEASSPADQQEEGMEGDDGVSSEGEKAASTEEGEEEGREAEASPSTNTRSRQIRGTPGGVARRSMRQSHLRGVSRSGPTPIVWGDQARQAQRQDMGHRGNRMLGQNFSPRMARRSRGRGQQRSPYGRF